ncbi:MAG: hypothetical protein KC776_38680 [Myxococcales bacterium]|nr:hypothetical protein [Myxococcales bacterium]MCB9575453.1 hypothetical protein [Polyangiaceae bacterium]
MVGVVEHGNSAVLVTLAANGKLLDRRRVDLTDGLPTHPHHHEGSWAVGRYLDSPWAKPTSLTDAIALVERVRVAAGQGAERALEMLAQSVAVPVASIALRECPELPATTEERIRDNRAQTYADTVMYRQALAEAARARDWTVRWYDRERVFEQASVAVAQDDIQSFLTAMGRAVGPPWQAQHKLAAAAALVIALGNSFGLEQPTAWRFRVEEVSAGVYRASGVDAQGRSVSATGTDPNRALSDCRAYAERVGDITK